MGIIPPSDLSAQTVGDEDGRLPFTHTLLDGLKISKDEVTCRKKLNSEILFMQKKLHLVLDLDHTLLHSKNLDRLASEDKHLMEQASHHHHGFQDSSDNSSELLKTDAGYLVKLRPYVRKFLKEASTMYDIYICTMGSRFYGEMISKLLDPENEYSISSRLIAREDFKERGRKDLDLVPGQERGVVIVDDIEDVWKKHKENLILIERYDYFKAAAGRRKNQRMTDDDEDELNGGLVNVLRVLETVHGLFFENPDENLVCRDVRSFLGNIRRGVLAGCKLFLGDIEEFKFPLLRRRAEELGAEFSDEFEEPVTHVVVSARRGIEDRQMVAEQEQQKKFLVHPKWVYATYYLWSRQAEKNFPV